MTDMDADALRLRKWQADIESHLAALESIPAKAVTEAGGLSPADKAEVETLKGAVSTLGEKIVAIEARVNDTSGLLAGVEAALGSHAHPTSPPAEPSPAPVSGPSEPAPAPAG